MATGDRINFNGDLTATAPTGGVTKGKIYLVDETYVVARETADAAATYLAAALGAVTATKLAATVQVFARGDAVYVDSNAVSVTGTGHNTPIGFALNAAAAAATTIDIVLTGAEIG